MGNTPLSVIARDPNTDLILLWSITKLKGGIELKETDNALQTGNFLFAPLADTPAISGIVSSGQLDLPKTSSAGYLGVTPLHNISPAKIYFVRSGGDYDE